MKLLQPFKKLPEGYYRLVMVGWLILPLLIAAIGAGMEERQQGPTFFALFIICIPIYYVAVRLIIWIYDGFKKDKGSS